MPSAKKGDRTEQQKDPESDRRVTPGTPKRLRKIACEKVANAPATLGVGAINSSMRTDDQAVKVVDKTWVARFGACNREVGSRATIDASQLAHLFAVQPSQRHAIQELQQLFQPLPGILTFIDEAIE